MVSDRAIEVRRLAPGDERAAEAFLARHPDSTLLLRSNLRAAGLRWCGQPLEGEWVAAERGRGIEGIAGHFWNDMILLQCARGAARDPREQDMREVAAALARAAAEQSGRQVAGVFGPHADVAAAIEGLGLADAPRRLDAACERLMALDLARLVVPPPLASGYLVARRSAKDDVHMLVAWRARFLVEAMHAKEGKGLLEHAREEIARAHEQQALWVVTDGGVQVATAAISGRLPDRVQVGAVYTPPELRGRHYARCVVAGLLRDVQQEGVRHAVLVTGDDSATAAYAAVGFAAVGEMSLVLFETAQRPAAPRKRSRPGAE